NFRWPKEKKRKQGDVEYAAKQLLELGDLTPSAELSNNWAANMFVIADRRTQSAIAYVGTLGQTFGSRISAGDNFYLNNLAQIKRKSIHASDSGFHRLLPTIMFKDDKITLAYAAPGGVMEISKSGPRTISVMILNKIANVSIDKAVVYPIVYPKGIDHNMAFKEGVPFLDHLNRNRVIQATKNTVDESVAIDGEGEKFTFFK
ncbi:unnamed protein product, partial [Angiostrongylus costaricensis]|uniref:Gamma-glutamyltransferase n=1 Tax=Angiostrongylus costaricensis TaxID=334426 RepID=A0A0R3Q2D0_ANGCS